MIIIKLIKSISPPSHLTVRQLLPLVLVQISVETINGGVLQKEKLSARFYAYACAQAYI